MKNRVLSYVLGLHTLLIGILGIAFFLFPKESATLWPWMFPPLAARFMGSLFIGGAVCSAVNLRLGKSHGVFVMALMGVGDSLIALTGVFAIGEIGLTPALILWLAFFFGTALLLIAAALLAARGMPEAEGIAKPRSLRRFFLIHLAVVLPVGLTMFFIPLWAQPLWPWMMSPINVRFLGAFFLGAAFISMWCLRQRSWLTVLPALALYAAFATTATVASLIHFSLFNPARITTWAFFGLYVFVAAGSWYFWWRFSRVPSSKPVKAA